VYVCVCVCVCVCVILCVCVGGCGCVCDLVTFFSFLSFLLFFALGDADDFIAERGSSSLLSSSLAGRLAGRLGSFFGLTGSFLGLDLGDWAKVCVCVYVSE
jgi:hypothetical protein